MYEFREIAVRRFAKYTILAAGFHFVLETLYTIWFGQHWLGLLPDYIAVALMVLAACLIILQSAGYVGFLCGAWGFAFCLNYRAWAWRFEAFLTDHSSPLTDRVMYILSGTLIISLISFAVSLWLCVPIARLRDDFAAGHSEK